MNTCLLLGRRTEAETKAANTCGEAFTGNFSEHGRSVFRLSEGRFKVDVLFSLAPPAARMDDEHKKGTLNVNWEKNGGEKKAEY